MVCPFSGKLCEECPLYRGRHYFLCFCQQYRGYLSETRDATSQPVSAAKGLRFNGKFEIPLIKLKTAFDPFEISALDQFFEANESERKEG